MEIHTYALLYCIVHRFYVGPGPYYLSLHDWIGIRPVGPPNEYYLIEYAQA